MKQIKFKGLVDNKVVKGNWYCSIRPSNPKIIAERLLQHKIDKFVYAIKEIKEGKSIKCEVK